MQSRNNTTSYYGILYCSPKRLESLKEFQDFVGIEQQHLIKHCPTRWLSLGRCVELLITQLPGLKSYFGAQPEVDRRISKVQQIFQLLNNPLLLPWLHFMDAFLEPLYKFNTRFQVGYFEHKTRFRHDFIAFNAWMENV